MTERVLSHPLDVEYPTPTHTKEPLFSPFPLDAPAIARMTAELIAGACHIPTSDDLSATVTRTFLTREQSFDPGISKFDITKLAAVETPEGPLSLHAKFPRICTDFANFATAETDASWIVARTGIAQQYLKADWMDKTVNECARGLTDTIREVRYFFKNGIDPRDNRTQTDKKSLLIGYALLTGQLVAILNFTPTAGKPMESFARFLMNLFVSGIVGNIGLRKMTEGIHVLPTVSAYEKLHLYTWR